MKQTVTRGIVLSRTNFAEADKIITVLTPDYGKLRLMAKGVRKAKSKLAGGIELFSVSDITFIPGRGEISTLVSARLDRHYGMIVKDIDRTMLGYELVKRLHKVTEDEPEPEYFDLLVNTLEALDNPTIPIQLIQTWFNAQLLVLAGHSPNVRTDTNGHRLIESQTYMFSVDNMIFEPSESGIFNSANIKFLRLLFSSNQPVVLAKIQGGGQLIKELAPFVAAMLQQHLHLRI